MTFETYVDTSWVDALLDPETALDGWIGAVIGALASAGVAIWVLVRTLRHERESFADQLRREREHAREQRASEAYAQLMTEVMTFATPRRKGEDATVRISATLARYQAWVMYLSAEHNDFADAMRRALRRLSELYVDRDATGVIEHASAIARWGARWHHEESRGRAAEWFERRYPEREIDEEPEGDSTQST